MLVEAQKVAGAILLALIVFMLAGMLGDVLVPIPEAPHEPQVAATEAPAEGEPAATADVGGPQPLPVRLAAASAEEGQDAIGQCRACHTFEEGGAARVGPNLYGTVGAEIAGHEGFAYSDALAGMGGEWTYENLDAFLEAPGQFAPGTKMTFAGVKDADERADIIAYLASISPQAPPLPEAEAAAEEAPPAEDAAEPAAEEPAAEEPAAEEPVAEAPAEEAAEPAAAGGFAALVAAAEPDAGASVANQCKACHTFEEGGPNRVGPNLHGIVGADIAAHEGFSYSQPLQALEGEWTYEKLDEFLANPMGMVPGTKMAFPGVKDEEKRAALVAYLRSLSPDAPPLPE